MDEFIREDGRSPTTFRNMKMKVGILNNADGSAYIEWGGNTSWSIWTT